MAPEEAYKLFEVIAQLTGLEENLIRYAANEEEQ